MLESAFRTHAVGTFSVPSFFSFVFISLLVPGSVLLVCFEAVHWVYKKSIQLMKKLVPFIAKGFLLEGVEASTSSSEKQPLNRCGK